ncbi:undecaprenyl/decaprenyl-phosphate alpha-N-acetylglucosaminyl 1-phosphate transferase [Gleimia sp. 6138-11-ORH1]|uniref:glycosyltransferase family 4 protein n=1 Tax=Gleimia sp. 6138-11-ORH1 TaxID=2973937 RepID=UPI00216A689F|nr:MraY family glycosyltransferase [Gleimia sp. 6138-11-ORH1]MCS4484092.1 undecaprenyl/decaprenyl-phosphate alpha-N-acetylglucosaminyl 1-phosphate transferase [Gleimia sp. 6138-11-ORH1]
MRLYILVFAVAALITFILTAVVRQIALAKGICAPVRDRDVHTTPIPRLGGIAMSLGFTLAILIAMKIPYFSPVFEKGQIWGVVIGVIGITVLGAVDDIYELDWIAKIAGQIIVAMLMVYFGVQFISFPIFGITIGSSTMSMVVTVLIIVSLMNAVNFVDGLDGLAAGVVGIGALAFFGYSYLLTVISEALTFASTASLISAALVGICFGFIPYNFHPASIFMGDAGAMSLGVLVASAGIIVTGQIDPNILNAPQLYSAIIPILLPILVVLLPIIDMLAAIIRRVSKGASPFAADKQHIHHQLLKLGHSHSAVALLMYLWTFLVTAPVVAILIFPSHYVLIATVISWIIGIFLTRKTPRMIDKLTEERMKQE